MSSPASFHCQRWSNGRHSWRHPADGGFSAAGYQVVELPEGPARRFVERHHYAGTYPAARFAYGLLARDDRLAVDGGTVDGLPLVGVAVLSVPMRASVLTNVFPDLQPYAEALELGRFVLTPTPANAESWFLARVWELAADAGVRGVVSFADPMPRQREVLDVDEAGSIVQRTELITPGHVGLIYQATNGHACGRSTARTLAYLPRHGVVLSARTLSKIRTQESGADSARSGTWSASALVLAGPVRIHAAGYVKRWPSSRSRRSATPVTTATPGRSAPRASDAACASPSRPRRTPSPIATSCPWPVTARPLTPPSPGS